MLLKSDLRKIIKKKINDALAAKELDREKESHRICRDLLASDFYKNAEAVFAYMALNDEVCLDFLLKNAFKDGKKVFIPKCDEQSQNDGIMTFYEIKNVNETSAGYMGILEPEIKDYNSLQDKYLNSSALILVPGRAFTLSGLRLGRGKGFYDKYFARHCQNKNESLVIAGVCFPQQIVDEIPVDKNDFKMDCIFF